MADIVLVDFPWVLILLGWWIGALVLFGLLRARWDRDDEGALGCLALFGGYLLMLAGLIVASFLN